MTEPQTQHGKKIKSDPLTNELAALTMLAVWQYPRANRPRKVKFDIKCSLPSILIIYTVTKSWVKWN